VEQVEGRHLIVLQAPGGMHRPYKAPASVKAKHKTRHYGIRRDGSTVEAKGADSLREFVPHAVGRLQASYRSMHRTAWQTLRCSQASAFG